MKKIIIIFISCILFFTAYQVRNGFLKTHDYNQPADAHEFLIGVSQIQLAIKSIHAIPDLRKSIPWIIEALDTHSAPVTMAYYATVNLLFPQNISTTNAVLSSLSVVFIFWASLFLSTFWIAILISIIAVIYTPHFVFIYSYMAESFGGFFIPTVILLAVLLLLYPNKKITFSILAGICIGLVALYRIELRWVGIPLTIAYFYFLGKERRHLFFVFAFFFSYALIVFGWMISAKLINTNSYYHSGNVIHVLHNTYSYKTYGWLFDTAPIKSFSELLQHIISQGPLNLFWLQLAIPIRLWTRPATAYVGEYPIPDSYLFSLHIVLVALALFGLRKAFFNKVFCFLAIPLVWASLLSFNPEELRRQVPLVGFLLLFAGAGISELSLLLKTRYSIKFFFLTVLLGGIMIANQQLVYGLLTLFYPRYITILPLKLFLTGILLFLAIRITLGLLAFDKKREKIIRSNILGKVPSMIPLIVVIVVLFYQSKMYNWHEWTTTLLPQNQIQQMIDIDPKVLSELRKKEGFLLIDMKDATSAKNIDVLLNRQLLTDRLSVSEYFSPIDMRVIRQFQRGMPRLGFGPVEESVRTSAMFPNMHFWLITKISGEILRDKNEIAITNTSVKDDFDTIVYGDYFSTSRNFQSSYDGPTPRIFQGPASFYKFQVDGEIRLPERRIIHSKNNTSTLYKENEAVRGDLSNSFGIQTGRYRIFLLFPYTTGDPEDIF